MANAGNPAAPARLSTFTIAAFAMSAVPMYAMLLMTSTFLPRFFAGHVGVSLIAVAAVLTSVRLIDIAFDPLIGAVMDRTRTPIGRYRPWLIIGTPLLMLAIYKLFNPPAEAEKNYLMIWMLVFYAGYSIFVLSHAAWAAAIATSYHERSRIFGWMQGLGVIGSSGLLLLPLLTAGRIQPGKAESMPAIALMIVVALPIAVAIVSIFSPERVAPKPAGQTFRLRDYWDAIANGPMRRIILADLLLTLGPGTTGPIYIFFFHDAKGFPVAEVSMLLLFYVAAGLAGSPFWSAVAQRLGKHRTLMVSCVAYAIMQTTLMIIPKGLFWETAAGMFAVGFSASAFVPLIRAMVGDVGDKVRLEQGKERVGLLYSMVTSTQKVGAALAVIVIYPILQAVGYNAADDAVNTPQAIFGLEMCYLFAPIAFVAVGTLSFLGYKLDDKAHAAIRAELDARDATARAEAAALEGGGIPALVVPGVVESKAS